MSAGRPLYLHEVTQRCRHDRPPIVCNVCTTSRDGAVVWTTNPVPPSRARKALRRAVVLLPFPVVTYFGGYALGLLTGVGL